MSRRTAGFIAAVAIELLILLALLSLGVRTGPADPAAEQVTTFDAREEAQPEAEAEAEEAPAAVPAPSEPQPPTPLTPVPPPPSALPRPGPVVAVPEPVATPQPQPTAEPSPTPPRARTVIRPGANFGPADTGRRGAGSDSQIVGTAPDGSPLYAAQWYTEPTDQQLAGFLSGIRGPAWGLIACRTAPNWRVEDCEVLGESPANSNMGNAVNAAAWQFLVRPPRVGGEYQIGSWVRIRITLGSGRGPGG